MRPADGGQGPASPPAVRRAGPERLAGTLTLFLLPLILGGNLRQETELNDAIHPRAQHGAFWHIFVKEKDLSLDCIINDTISVIGRRLEEKGRSAAKEMKTPSIISFDKDFDQVEGVTRIKRPSDLKGA